MDEKDVKVPMDDGKDAVASAPPVTLMDPLNSDVQGATFGNELPPPPYSEVKEVDVITQQPTRREDAMVNASTPIVTPVTNTNSSSDRSGDCCDDCCEGCMEACCSPNHCHVPIIIDTHHHGSDCNCDCCAGCCDGCGNCGNCGNCGDCGDCSGFDKMDCDGDAAIPLLLGAIACFICIIVGVLCYQCCKEKQEAEEEEEEERTNEEQVRQEIYPETSVPGRFTFKNAYSDDVESIITKQPSAPIASTSAGDESTCKPIIKSK